MNTNVNTQINDLGERVSKIESDIQEVRTLLIGAIQADQPTAPNE